MKKIKSRIISVLLFICIILGNIQMVRADNLDIIPFETYVNEEEGYSLTKMFDGEKVTVLVKSLDESVENVIESYNGEVYLDGELIRKNTFNSVNVISDLKNEIFNSVNAYSSSWGEWHYTDLDSIKTGGYPTAIVAGLIAALAPWLTAKTVATVAGVTAGMYKEVQIKMRIRYREDDDYLYYERDTWFYGDGELAFGPVRDSGKEYLY